MNLLLENQTKVQVLGSGSRGNATLIAGGNDVILVDAGLSGQELIHRLNSTGVTLDQLKGIILTHEHNDHVRGLKGLLKRKKIPVWGNEQTISHLRTAGYQSDCWNLFSTGGEFQLGNMFVRSFTVPHDAYDPCGFTVSVSGIHVGIVTDLGYWTTEVQQAVCNCHILCLEANYDAHLLSEDTRRPWATKQRISARHGHLSNAQAAELLASFKGRNSPLRHVFVGHMSEDCNSPDLALSEIQRGIQAAGIDAVKVHLTYQSKVSEPVVI